MPPEARAQARILVVEDDREVGPLFAQLLKRAGFDPTLVGSSFEGRRALARQGFELALCDINLPGESGLELARHLVQRYPDTAVLMVSGLDDPQTARTAIELGAYGYIVKPFTHNELLIGVLNALRRRELEFESRERREELETAVRKQTAALWQTIERLKASEDERRRSETEAIRRLAAAIEFRDAATGIHIERMSGFVAHLALEAGLTPERCELLRLASPLHDIGKIAIADQILLKPGPLTEAERATMNTHAEIGHRMLAGSGIELLDVAATIARTHHEQFDGRGYPEGLRGGAIPVEGRIVALADVFDALTSGRPYRPAFPFEHAVEMMRSRRGSHFDPELLDLFLVSVASPPLFEVGA
jgi:cyclic di-GMP phosphodiesterase